MLVRALHGRQRGGHVRLAALAAFAAFTLVAPRPRALLAQQPAAQIPATHTVKRGDTLWDIAKLYLGDPFLWPEVYRLNSALIEDPHWIYPGEVLKLPGPTAKVIAVTPPAVDEPAPVSRAFMPPTAAVETPTRQSTPATAGATPTTVRVGEFAASPWVDQKGGPGVSGYILESAELSGIASTDRSRMQLYDRVFLVPPAGAVATEHARYLSYRLGPFIEGFGQIVIPTGVIEVTRTPGDGEAAVGRVVKMFGEVLQEQRLIAYDTSGALVTAVPAPITNGRSGTVRWIMGRPVLASLQGYVAIDISRQDGVSTGDLIDFYQPRQRATESHELAIPEVFIGRAQVLRVTQFGATAIITKQDQPKIEQGTAARVSAKMP